jgi:hypothetical protein
LNQAGFTKGTEVKRISVSTPDYVMFHGEITQSWDGYVVAQAYYKDGKEKQSRWQTEPSRVTTRSGHDYRESINIGNMDEYTIIPKVNATETTSVG